MILSIGFMLLAPVVGLLLDHLQHDYRYTFLIGSGLAVAALFSTLILHRKFMQLGGPDHYTAPE